MLQPLTAAQAREFEAALRLLQAGRAEQALTVAKPLAAGAARAPDARQLLAMCYAEAGNAVEAEKAFLSALQLAPDHPLILVNYAVMLRKAGRREEALAPLQRAVETAPDHAKAWTELGITALEVGRHQQALVSLERAVALQPQSVLAWHGLGNSARALGDLEAAEAAFKKAITLAPGHRAAAINLGAVLRLSGRPDEAIACFEGIRKNGPDSPELADALVGALLDDGRLDESLQLARRVAADHPDFVPGLVTLATLLWEYAPTQESDDSSLALFRTAIRHRPDDHALRVAFAQWLLSTRTAAAGDEALEEIRRIRASADEPPLSLMEANALELIGRTEQAGTLYAQLHRAWGQGVPEFLNAYARHLLRAGQWDAAARMATEATQADPENQAAWAYLATAWRLLGDPREDWLCDYDRLIALVEIEPPPGFVDQAQFLDALAAILHPMHKARREPIQQSLRGGSQTPGRLFGRRDPLLVETRSSLLRGVERWLATLPTDDRHPFLTRRTRSVRLGGSWSVKLWSSGRHANHVHPEGWISSAFYVSLPPSVTAADGGSQAGHIQFGQPPSELDLGLPPRRVIRPEPGKLALFPSYMWHGTVPFDDAQPRITIAFDMTPLAGSFT